MPADKSIDSSDELAFEPIHHTLMANSLTRVALRATVETDEGIERSRWRYRGRRRKWVTGDFEACGGYFLWVIAARDPL